MLCSRHQTLINTIESSTVHYLLIISSTETFSFFAIPTAVLKLTSQLWPSIILDITDLSLPIPLVNSALEMFFRSSIAGFYQYLISNLD